MMKKTWLFLLFFSLILSASAQNNGYLKNPSFEDYPGAGKVPKKWLDCGFARETPPDIQPNGIFHVYTQPQHGDTYLGLVVRDNDTWESVTQELLQPLQKDEIYQLDIYLARSELYVSVSRVTEETANYNEPVILRIYGSNEACQQGELIAESTPIINHEWEKYSFDFQATADWKYVKLEAYFAPNSDEPYNGNLLLDNCFLALKNRE